MANNNASDQHKTDPYVAFLDELSTGAVDPLTTGMNNNVWHMVRRYLLTSSGICWEIIIADLSKHEAGKIHVCDLFGQPVLYAILAWRASARRHLSCPPKFHGHQK